MSVRRFDSGELKLDAKRTPQGFLRCDAVIARTGIQIYLTADGGMRREYRPPDEVFHADALASAAEAPITFTPDTRNWHPQEPVTPQNARQYAVGWTGAQVKADGAVVRTTATIMDATAIAAAESGQFAQLSCGYTADLEMKPGTTPAGEKYDAIQRNIRINHVALVKVARAGPEARLRLDSNDNAVQDALPPQGGRKMAVKKTVAGITFEVDEQLAQALDKQDSESAAALKVKDGEVTAAKKLAESEKARADVAAQKADAAEKARADAEDPAKTSARVASRVALETKARAVLGAEAKFDGKDELTIKREVLAKAQPGLKLDGQSPDYIAAAFDLIAAAPPKPTVARKEPKLDTGADLDEGPMDEYAAREAMKKQHRDSWKQDAGAKS